MTERKDKSETALGAGALGLDAFFDAAKAETPQPGGDFLARIEAEALAEQPGARDTAPVVAAARPARQSVLAQLREALGGWVGMAGLATACAAGIWIGVSPPEGLSTYLGGEAAALSTFGVDPLGTFDLALMDG